MIKAFKRITIVKIKKPQAHNLNQEIQQFSKSLGLFNIRDKEKSCFRIFVELLKSAKTKKPVSSDELAYKLNLTRGTVVHHLNKLIDAGIVTVQKNKYMLRVKNLKLLIEELKKDVDETFSELKELAKDIDESLELKN